MSRNNSSCGLLSLAFFIMFVIISAFTGNLEYLYFLVGIFAILFVIVAIGDFNSSKKKSKFEDSKSLDLNLSNKPLVREDPIKLKQKPYIITEKFIGGQIKGVILPKEIAILTKIKSIKLFSKNEIEISKFINQNSDLYCIELDGPFWLENELEKKNQLTIVHIKKNDKIEPFLEHLSKQTELKYLSIIHNSKMDLKCFLPLLKNVTEFTLDCLINEFPTDLLRNEKLQSLNLSNNKIQKISIEHFDERILKNTNLKTLNLSGNRLKTIPLKLFDLKSLDNVILNNNPIRARNIKRLYKDYRNRVTLDSGQYEIIFRRFHPTSWLLIKIVFSIAFVAIPYMVFDSAGLSIIFFAFVVIAWKT
ncbi:leucine-rich repeat domain-containing protein [Flavimarina sp. Hel_I_48]|uniref:leucine-rich repeat domain-containing protein n=1 Tax=Flavimarina sp. Hel_I_48 TaxID=1392488 RepID=UPI0004DF7595|nr:leucine-rich repeat domain-containing protein [Flavimarina sp. Hel_I_48]